MERGKRKRTAAAAVSQWAPARVPPTPNTSCHVFRQPLLENVSLKLVVERAKKKTLRNEELRKVICTCRGKCAVVKSKTMGCDALASVDGQLGNQKTGQTQKCSHVKLTVFQWAIFISNSHFEL